MVVKAPEERLGYLEVRDHLLARIARGEIPIHSRMPTIQQTSRDLGVSYVTAQRAYRTLAEQGVVRSGRGQPATVIAKAPQRFVKPLVVGGIFRAAKALNPRDNYGAEMTEAILRTLAENGVSVLYRHLDDAGFEEAFLSDVASGRLGGVLGDELTPDALLQSAVALGLPVVAFNRTRAPGGVTCVCPDHEWNGRFTARKVMELGYGRVVVCKTSRADLRSAEKDRIRAQSIDAYVGAVAGELARLGMADAMISRIPEEAAVPRDPWFDPDWVRPWLEPLARDSQTRTAFVCPSDTLALFLADQLRSLGALGAGRCGVVGRYDLEINRQAGHPVSTWRIDPAEVGRAAASRLLDKIEFPDRLSRDVYVKPVFVDHGTL